MTVNLNPNAFAQINNKPADIDYKAVLKTCLLDPDVMVPEPDIVLSINHHGIQTPVFTKQSISGIIGKAKGGKTTFVALVTAAVMKQELGNDNLMLSSNAAGKILFFDTEQGKYYGYITLMRILKLSQNKDRLKYFDLRAYTPDMRLVIIKEAMKEEEEIAMVVIDGGRDIIYDINSPDQAITVISELMTLSVKHTTHICTILHQNKGDNNARGHFGTELVNKSETIISINKSSHDKSIAIIEADFTRGMPFEPLTLCRNEDGTPYLTDVAKADKIDVSTKGIYPNKIPVELHNKVIEAVFTSADGLLYSTACRAIRSNFSSQGTNFGESKAKYFLDYYLQSGWLVKSEPSKGYAKYSKPDISKT